VAAGGVEEEELVEVVAGLDVVAGFELVVGDASVVVVETVVDLVVATLDEAEEVLTGLLEVLVEVAA
jgi:hypothetical protein